MKVEARTWFHAGAWLGLGATVYTNYRAAPVQDLQVAYLIVPVLMAALSEGLIRTWERLHPAHRSLLAGLLFALVAVSYEHLRHLTLTAGGTWFAATVGAAVIDGAIFGCVLATASLSRTVPVLSRDNVLLRVPAGQDRTEAGQDAVPAVSCQDSPVPVLSRVDVPVAIPSVPEEIVLSRAEKVAVRPVPANDRDNLSRIRDVVGDRDATSRDVRDVLSCGGTKADRLALLYNKERANATS